jgi:hypothetical protein
MGTTASRRKIGFEDLQLACSDPPHVSKYIIINTLNSANQDCLIYNTVLFDQEELTINKYLKSSLDVIIIVYGLNACDDTVIKKYDQLTSLGFYNVYMYVGGLFEWLLLQDIYGDDEFKTTKKELDVLKYKPGKQFGLQYLK